MMDRELGPNSSTSRSVRLGLRDAIRFGTRFHIIPNPIPVHARQLALYQADLRRRLVLPPTALFVGPSLLYDGWIRCPPAVGIAST